VLAWLKNRFGVLLAMAKVGFASYLAYPAGVAMVFVSYPIIILMYRFVFSAVFAHSKEVAGYSLDTMLTYVTISWLLNTFYMTPTGRMLGMRVRDGQVAMDLIKPVNLMTLYFGQGLGRTAFRVSFATLPLLILFSLLTQVNPPALATLPAFAATVLCGYLINFQLDYMIGLVAFYLEYNNGIRWGIRLMMSIIGGMVIPLNYFPEWVERIFRLFPTQYMFFQPLQIYLGRVEPYAAWSIAAQALAWVLVIFVLAQLMQRDGLRRLSLSGG
jgi:ABC-2 type transport system permease protein